MKAKNQGKRAVWMIVAILSFLFIGGAVWVGLKLASINSGYSKFYSYQMEICLEGDILYYCDHNREAELYAYNLKTGEEVMVTEQQGAPYKTSHGCFYLIEGLVYEIEDLQLHFLCKEPENGDFLDYADGKILWAKRNHFTVREFESFSRQVLYLQEGSLVGDDLLLSEEGSEKIYDISDSVNSFFDVAWMGEKLYIGQEDGLVCVNLTTEEKTQVYHRDIMGVYTDGTFLVFESRADDPGYRLFYIEPESGQVRKIEDAGGDVFLLLKDGVVYYKSSGIAKYDIESGITEKLTKDSPYSRQDYYMAEIYENTMILRHGYDYYFAEFDVSEGEVKRVTE